jgi:AcrR family transcriptional regulator
MLKAAVGILAEKGFGGLTLNDVGEAAGFSRGLPAHYYGTKEQMVGVLARHIVRAFGTAMKKQPRVTGLAALLAACGAYFKGAARDPVTMRALLITTTEAMINPAIAAAVAEVNARSIEGLAHDISAGQAAGEIRRDVDALASATLILGQLRGAIALWLTEPAAIDLERLRAEHLARLKESLVP